MSSLDFRYSRPQNLQFSKRTNSRLPYLSLMDTGDHTPGVQDLRLCWANPPYQQQHLLLSSPRLFPPESFGFGGSGSDWEPSTLTQATDSRLVGRSDFWPATAVSTSPESLTRLSCCVGGRGGRGWRKSERELCNFELFQVWEMSTEEVPLELGVIRVKSRDS